jgi:hypothetical protein
MRKLILYVELPDGSIEELPMPTRKAVCPTCRGTGSHSHAVDGNGLTAEDFDQDPDFAEAYMRGDYDRICEECAGANVIDALDESRCAPATLEAFRKQETEYWADYNSEAALRRAESGERW